MPALSTELRVLRQSIAPVISPHFRQVLIQAERKLATDEKPTANRKTPKKPTKAELRARFHAKGL